MFCSAIYCILLCVCVYVLYCVYIVDFEFLIVITVLYCHYYTQIYLMRINKVYIYLDYLDVTVNVDIVNKGFSKGFLIGLTCCDDTVNKPITSLAVPRIFENRNG